MSIPEDIKKLVKQLNIEEVTLPELNIEKNAIDKIPSYLISHEYKNIVLVVDENTRKAAGNKIEHILSRNDFRLTIVELAPNKYGEVIADERTLIQFLVEIPNSADVILAVGSGTIHDIVRFASFKMSIPFISVPTAASVDGYTSKGAPLIFQGVKKTIQTASPVAVFADIDIIKDAPREMTAAGFGDIIGKYTSLLDWEISSLIGKEPYNQLAADLTRRSLDNCIHSVQEIAKREDKGIKILMQALIESGLVMLVLDFSRPASGSEHHLSHYWEMDLLKKDAKQLLHGAKVGVATTIIIDLYKQIITDIDPDLMSTDSRYLESFTTNWEQIKQMMKELPSSQQIKDLLKTVAGPTTPEELNIEHSLVSLSLNEAFHLRDRCTGLFLANQFKQEDFKYPIEKLSF
ncbi:glycerol-1-phosphate dehydrogenase [NAD(P)+] [Virgibacillus natechei]|uniref:Glycerol-1-phosphate dehydrogenase [NAD(P)+] n=1 Tax=Virgibacillus natechei TaxID=1216297 RepID=A0ABS4IFP0_9BACI|nr:sn-glycerol-1-phosphate dehydrogenase [Virgibacillus natechei]MBP1969281.1 glycerol-1-phosphate dehydrogenase [NAD(P)+] [Virgibacillus natechei]UZD12436.1 sn-glycerol-1-phosphate dehydrogenase [Virgibacillus natechei]